MATSKTFVTYPSVEIDGVRIDGDTVAEIATAIRVRSSQLANLPKDGPNAPLSDFAKGVPEKLRRLRRAQSLLLRGDR